MERQPQGGEHQYPDLRLIQGEQAEAHRQESHDERVIREGIEAALVEERNIDDRTARYIASQLHEGQASALYALASSGAILDEVHDELTRDYNQQPEVVQNWINWLGVYCMDRPDAGPVEGWAARAAEQDRAEEEAQARQELMERISAAGVTTLGEVAVVIQADDATEPDDGTPEPDDTEDADDVAGTFVSWADAMRYRPDDVDIVAGDDSSSEQPQAGEGEGPDYDDDDCCTACGIHISEPHAVECPLGRSVEEQP